MARNRRARQPRRGSAKNYLIDAKPVKIAGSQVLIGFDPEFADNKEKSISGVTARPFKKPSAKF